MFKQDMCDLCGDCLVDCQWMDIERSEAVEWLKAMIRGEDTPALKKCICCYACNELCPKGANPFDLMAELQEKYHSISTSDFIASQEAMFMFNKELQPPPQADRIMTTCIYGNTHAHLIQGELFDLPRIGGKPYFCYVLFTHIGGDSIQKKHAQEFVDRVAKTGAKEVVCFHDDCYAMLTWWAPSYGIKVPFRAIHFTEYLVEYLEANKDRIKPINMKLAYQRPCASRLSPDKQYFVDELFELVGAKRVKRVYDRENALCCAGVKELLGTGDPKPDQDKNILDAKNAGADAMVCLCPICNQVLSPVGKEHKLPIFFVSDIARMALGEKISD